MAIVRKLEIKIGFLLSGNHIPEYMRNLNVEDFLTSA